MILVTGMSGYIGSHTAVALLGGGYDIVGFDNFYNSSPDAVEAVKKITGKDFPFSQFDTALSVTPNFSANCSCVNFCFFLLSPPFFFQSSFIYRPDLFQKDAGVL